MKRVIIATIAVALALTGCSSINMSEEQMQEIAKARQTCKDLGGVFRQWTDGFNNERWLCDFQESE